MNGIDNGLIINNLQSYTFNLGRFRQNFNNLEHFLRLYLNKKKGKDNIYALQFINLSEGDICEENAITDRKSFGELCNSFNNNQIKNDKIDFNDIIKFRDALAHGRVLSDNMGNMTVIKYSKPKDGKVTVEYKSALTIKKLEEISEKIQKIVMEISIRGGAKIEN